MATENALILYDKVAQYAFTLTLKPKMYRLTPRAQYKKAVFELNNIVDTKMYPKLTIDYCTPELTKSANIHFHGVISVNLGLNDCDRYYVVNAWFQNMFRASEIFGHILLKPIDHYEKWYTYCHKDLEGTGKILRLQTMLVFVKQNTMNIRDKYLQLLDDLATESSQLPENK